MPDTIRSLMRIRERPRTSHDVLLRTPSHHHHTEASEVSCFFAARSCYSSPPTIRPESIANSAVWNLQIPHFLVAFTFSINMELTSWILPPSVLRILWKRLPGSDGASNSSPVFLELLQSRVTGEKTLLFRVYCLRLV